MLNESLNRASYIYLHENNFTEKEIETIENIQRHLNHFKQYLSNYEITGNLVFDYLNENFPSILPRNKRFYSKLLKLQFIALKLSNNIQNNNEELFFQQKIKPHLESSFSGDECIRMSNFYINLIYFNTRIREDSITKEKNEVLKFFFNEILKETDSEKVMVYLKRSNLDCLEDKLNKEENCATTKQNENDISGLDDDENYREINYNAENNDLNLEYNLNNVTRDCLASQEFNLYDYGDIYFHRNNSNFDQPTNEFYSQYSPFEVNDQFENMNLMECFSSIDKENLAINGYEREMETGNCYNNFSNNNNNDANCYNYDKGRKASCAEYFNTTNKETMNINNEEYFKQTNNTANNNLIHNNNSNFNIDSINTLSKKNKNDFISRKASAQKDDGEIDLINYNKVYKLNYSKETKYPYNKVFNPYNKELNDEIPEFSMYQNDNKNVNYSSINLNINNNDNNEDLNHNQYVANKSKKASINISHVSFSVDANHKQIVYKENDAFTNKALYKAGKNTNFSTNKFKSFNNSQSIRNANNNISSNITIQTKRNNNKRKLFSIITPTLSQANNNSNSNNASNTATKKSNIFLVKKIENSNNSNTHSSMNNRQNDKESLNTLITHTTNQSNNYKKYSFRDNNNKNKLIKESINTITTSSIISIVPETKTKLKKNTPKFTKNETINRSIIRLFRTYLKQYKERLGLQDFITNNKDSKFWSYFIEHENNLLPPCFKSYSNNYLYWVFSHDQCYELYIKFINHEFEKVFNHFIENNNYKKLNSEDEKSKLKKYLTELFPLKFSKNNKNRSSSISKEAKTSSILNQNYLGKLN